MEDLLEKLEEREAARNDFIKGVAVLIQDLEDELEPEDMPKKTMAVATSLFCLSYLLPRGRGPLQKATVGLGTFGPEVSKLQNKVMPLIEKFTPDLHERCDIVAHLLQWATEMLVTDFSNDLLQITTHRRSQFLAVVNAPGASTPLPED